MAPLLLPRLTLLVALFASLSSGSTLAASSEGGQVALDIVPPLFADDGSTYPCALRGLATDLTAEGPATGCATPAQRGQLMRLHPARVVSMGVDSQGVTSEQAPVLNDSPAAVSTAS